MSDNWIKLSEPAVLGICICGQHNNGYLPISQLQGTNVLLHYVDKNGDIKAWDGDVQKQIEDAIEKTKQEIYSSDKNWRQSLAMAREKGYLEGVEKTNKRWRERIAIALARLVERKPGATIHELNYDAIYSLLEDKQ